MKIKLPYSEADAEINRGPLPPILRFHDGTPVKSTRDWKRRLAEIEAAIIPVEYGGMPPETKPKATKAEPISESSVEKFTKVPGSSMNKYAVTVEGGAEPVNFGLTVWTPGGDGPFPVVLNGDACWSYLTPQVVAMALRRGFAIASFNRCEVARDRVGAQNVGIYRAFPGTYGALSAWAWTYHRAYDALLRNPRIDTSKVIVTGHSRGGKTVELATATDKRIAMVADNCSGCGGFGCFRVSGKGCEHLSDITRAFPFWFAPDFAKWAGHEEDLPFDQHYLAALIAPRLRLVQVAKGDTWANPVGACVSFRASVEAYRFLGAEENNHIVFRNGGHSHSLIDWRHTLDFAEKHLLGK